MTGTDYGELIIWLKILREVAKEYSGKTLDNIIQQMEARKKEVKL